MTEICQIIIQYQLLVGRKIIITVIIIIIILKTKYMAAEVRAEEGESGKINEEPNAMIQSGINYPVGKPLEVGNSTCNKCILSSRAASDLEHKNLLYFYPTQNFKLTLLTSHCAKSPILLKKIMMLHNYEKTVKKISE